MTSWAELQAAEPAFAARVEAVLDEHKHKVMATVRPDGGPRVSGTEVDRVLGDLWLGSMPGAVKALDLQRDPRVAIHSAPVDHTLAVPDVKLDAIAVEITDAGGVDTYLRARADDGSPPPPPGPFHLFRLDLRRVTVTAIGEPADHLVIETWTPSAGLRRIERR